MGLGGIICSIYNEISSNNFFVSLYLCGYNRLSYFDHGKYDNMNIY